MPGQETIELFAKYGGLIGLLVGVMFVSMAVAVVFLWRHNLALHKTAVEVEEKHRTQLQAVQDKRVAEAIEVRKELIGLSEDFNKAVSELNSTINALKDAVLLRDRG